MKKIKKSFIMALSLLVIWGCAKPLTPEYIEYASPNYLIVFHKLSLGFKSEIRNKIDEESGCLVCSYNNQKSYIYVDYLEQGHTIISNKLEIQIKNSLIGAGLSNVKMTGTTYYAVKYLQEKYLQSVRLTYTYQEKVFDNGEYKDVDNRGIIYLINDDEYNSYMLMTNLYIDEDSQDFYDEVFDLAKTFSFVNGDNSNGL